MTFNKALILFVGLATSACGALAGGTINTDPVVYPRPVAFITCEANATVSVGGGAISEQLPAQVTDAQGNAGFAAIPGSDVAFNLVITKPGYEPYQRVVVLPPGAHQFILGNCVPLTSPGFQIQLPAWSAPRAFAPEAGRLHVVDRHFETEDGQPWSWRGSSMFLLFARDLQGEDIGPQIAWMEARGVNIARVWGSVNWDNLRDYGITIDYARPFERPDFDQRLGAFFDRLAAHGIRVEYTPITYADDVTTMRGVVQRAYDLAASRWNVLVEVCNECENNGVDPVAVLQGVDRRGVVSSYGLDPGRHCVAEGAGDAAVWEACMRLVGVLEYVGAHDLARDDQHSPRNTKDFTIDFAGIYRRPFVADEHVGLVDRTYPRYCYRDDGFASLCTGGGVRTTDCNVWLSAAGIEHLFGPGFTLHLQAGLEGRAPRADEPIQTACAEQLTKLWQFIPARAQLGAYNAPHLSGFPYRWVDADSKVGHSYCSPLGNEAWCVNPMPSSTWPGFVGANGWTLDVVGPVPYVAKFSR